MLCLKSLEKCVNALNRAKFISTNSDESQNYRKISVNALNRAKFISTKVFTVDDKIVIACQCPKSGEVHFYYAEAKALAYEYLRVNALNRAKFIST